MNKGKWRSIGVGLAVVGVGLSVVSYTVYNRLINEVKLLGEDVKDKSRTLKEVEGKFSQAEQKNVLFVAEKESLDREIALQKKRVMEIQQVQDRLREQQKALTGEKEGLEVALEKIKKLHQKQIELGELKDESREKNFKKKVDSRISEFISDKEALEKKVKNVEAKLKESAQRNQELLTKLSESSQTIIRLKLESGEENNQSGLISQEDQQFQKEVLKFYYNAGLAYEQSRQFDLALIEYEKALAAVPDDSDTHYNLAIIYDEYLVDKKKAIEHYQAYLKFCPDAKDVVKVSYWIREAKKELEWENR